MENDTLVSDKEVVFPDANRIGKFNIMYEVLHDGAERPMLQALFGLCLVLDTVEHDSGRGRTYFASSALFQPLNPGDEIPEYRIESAWLDLAFKNPEHEQDCIKNAGFRFKAIRNTIIRVPPASFGTFPRTPNNSVH